MKIETQVAILIGIMVGAMALVILSFSILINKKMEVMNLEKQIKIDLIESANGICSEVYPVVIVRIENDIIMTKCRTRH